MKINIVMLQRNRADALPDINPIPCEDEELKMLSLDQQVAAQNVQHVRNSCFSTKGLWDLYCYLGPKWRMKMVFGNVQTACRCNPRFTETFRASSMCANQKMVAVATEARWASHFNWPNHTSKCCRSLECDRREQICRIPGTWHNASTVNITIEEFCQHRKKKKSCQWLLNNHASDCWTIVPAVVE